MRPPATRSEVQEYSVGVEIPHAVQSDSRVSAVGRSAVRERPARLRHSGKNLQMNTPGWRVQRTSNIVKEAFRVVEIALPREEGTRNGR